MNEIKQRVGENKSYGLFFPRCGQVMYEMMIRKKFKVFLFFKCFFFKFKLEIVEF